MVIRAAEDYWHNHDGWEDIWPLTISLQETEYGEEKGRFEVEMESHPTFNVVLSKKG